MKCGQVDNRTGEQTGRWFKIASHFVTLCESEFIFSFYKNFSCIEIGAEIKQ